MQTVAPKADAPKPWRVLRAFWYEGAPRAAGDIVMLPRVLAAELRAAAKVEPAPAPEPVAEAKPAPKPAAKKDAA
jgi:hypothetical protein